MYEITKEASVLLHLLRRNFRPDTELLPHSVLETVDWQAVMQESAHQAVLISAFDAVAAYKKYIPAAVYQHWFQRASRGMMSNLRVNNAQRELISLLEAHGYPYVILKGESAASYYPRPELRHLGDVDFLIDPAQKEEIVTLLTTNEYEGGKHENRYHTEFHKDGAGLELHFDLPGMPNGASGERIHHFVKDILPLAATTDKSDGQANMPVPAHHGLVLLLHMQHHMVSEGLGLRHLCDWAVFVDRTGQQPFWQKKLLPLLKEIGLFRYASVMTVVASSALGTACPDWALAEEEICNAVLHDILTGGNFGRKDALRSRSGLLIPKERNGGMEKGQLVRLWTTLHQTTATMYPIVRKFRVLYPVLDVYRVGVYCVRRLKGKRPSMVTLAPLARERRSVYEQLEIFETEE